MPLGMIAKTVCTLLAAIGFASIGGSAIAAEPAGAGTAANANSSLGSGIDLKYVDPAVRPQDDFYRAVNGKWLDTFEMPVDKARYGSFDKLREDTELQLKAIIEDVAKSTDVAPGSEAQKIRDLYNSFMNEAKIEEVGTKPLVPLFARIDAVKDKVAFVPGQGFHPDGSGTNTMRLNFSNVPPDQLREGVRRLGAAIQRRLDKATPVAI